MTRFSFFLLCLSVIAITMLSNAHAGGDKGYERFLQRHDANADGQVTEAEFQGKPRMFQRFDLNGDGVISVTEFKQVRQDRSANNDKQEHRRANLTVPDGVKMIRDLEYAKVDGMPLRLDLYLPQTAHPPLFVWIHGGGWARGDKADINPSIIELTRDGFAVASLNYRLGGVSLHPKQVQDLKGAIRWLRANSGQYGYDAEQIAVGGGSAGGHLALLLGLSGGVAELEGDVGGNRKESSRVQAIVDLYGPSDLEAYAKANPKFQRRKTDELLRSASPLQYLSADDPPLLVMHGEQDPVVPVAQSQRLHERYVQAGLDAELHILPGAGHGGRPFKDRQTYQWIRQFLQKHLGETAVHEPTTGNRAVEVGKRVSASEQGVERPVPVSTDQQAKLHGFHWMIGPRAGLEGSQQQFERLLQVIDRNLSNNPYITGVYIIYHWRLLEPVQGQLDFTRLDRVIERVRQHGRYYKLAINPGIYSPDWLYAKGAQAFDTLGSNPARKQIYQQHIRMPVPWDPVFQANYFDALAKVAQRYRDDRHFRAVTLTVATFMSPEWHLPKSSDDLRQWQGLGDYPQRLEQTWEQGIDRFAAIFPNQILVLEASSNPLGLKQLGDAVVQHGVTRYAGRFAVQINQLNGKRDQAGQAGYRKLIDYKHKYGSDILIGLQNLKGWGGEKLQEQQGSLQMSAYNFIQAGADYWELWYHDGNSREICQVLANLQQDAAHLGLDGFKRKLIKAGEYQPFSKS